MKPKWLFNAIVMLAMTLASCSVSEESAPTHPINIKYLGGAGWELSNGDLKILIDPFLSRQNIEGVKFWEVAQPDSAQIDSIITDADYILVHHSHYDHLGDVHYIAKKTGATVIGTETTMEILSRYDVSEKIISVKGGEDYQLDGFSVRVIPSLHSALYEKGYIDSRTYDESNNLEAPLKRFEFIEGGSLMFLIRLDGRSILTMGSMNFIERELEGINPDVLIAGANRTRLEIYDYDRRLMQVTGYPRHVFPTHWDNLGLPFNVSQDSLYKEVVVPFMEAISAVSPKSVVHGLLPLETVEIK